MPSPRSISCTIMAFNEEASMEEATRDVVTELRKFDDRELEVLIVDDGSTDATPRIAAEMADKYAEVRVITHPQNRGPGSALITGFAESKNDVICFHAADQQLPFEEVAALIPLLDQYDMVIGDRTDRPDYTRMRLLSSKVYITLAHNLYGLRQFKDFNFLYLYRKSLLDRIQVETTGVFMPTEILIKAVDLGASIVPATVTCLPRTAGEATCGRPNVVIHTVREMLRFYGLWRWRKVFGEPSAQYECDR
jgi:glycosyltransferase involved in cell wall biosynthesis